MRTLEEFNSIVKQPIDPAFIKERSQGGQTFSYISTDRAIEMLNEAFDYCWSYEAALMEGQQDSRGNQIVIVKGRLSAKVKLDDAGIVTEIVKEQFGTNTVRGGQWDTAVKGASSDAMKKCAVAFGIGMQLYPNSSWNTWTASDIDKLSEYMKLQGEKDVDKDKCRKYLGDNPGIKPPMLDSLIAELTETKKKK